MKRQIWKELGRWSIKDPDGVRVDELKKITSNMDDNVLISTNDYDEENSTVVYVGCYKEETDEEYNARVAEAKRVKESAERIIGHMVPLDKYNELVEKAARYDALKVNRAI